MRLRSTSGVALGAVALAAAIGLCAEWGAHSALPEVPSCIDAPRHPYRYRGWPEYMRGAEKRGPGKTLVLLTNCQGYGGEYPASKGYAPRLERLLRENDGREWQVLNWAVDGCTSIEYMFMAAYLQEQQPDVVLALTSYADYRDEHFREGFSYCRSDVPRLLARRSVRRNLPDSFLRRHARTEDFLKLTMSNTFALPRFKEFSWSWVDRRLPGCHNVFFAPNVYYLPWALPKQPLIRAIELPHGDTPPLVVSYGEGSRVMLREYVSQLAAVPARVVVAAQPIRDRGVAANEAFLQDLHGMAAESGLVYWDLHDALPSDRFLTSGHLHFKNHRRLAELLAERLLALEHADAPGESAPQTRDPRHAL